jgi:hypothetical protein
MTDEQTSTAQIVPLLPKSRHIRNHETPMIVKTEQDQETAW